MRNAKLIVPVILVVAVAALIGALAAARWATATNRLS